MIIGVGIDFVEINRIELVFKKWGSVFSRKILSKKELHFFSSYKNSRLPFLAITYLAKRFAAKEAIGKALGLGIRHPVSFKSIEISFMIFLPVNISPKFYWHGRKRFFNY